MASLYTRTDKDGEKIYYANYVVDGRRVRKSVGKNKRLAELALKEIEVKVKKQELGFEELKEIPLADLVEKYLEHSKRVFSEDTYRKDHKSRLSGLVVYLGNRKVSKITRNDIEGYVQQRLEHVRPVSVQGALKTIRAFVNKAIEWKHLKNNPCDGIHGPKQQQNTPRFLSKEETRNLLEAAEGHHLQPLIATALYAGLRRRELVWLEWQDIDPFRYLRDVLARISDHKASRLAELLPGNWKPADQAQSGTASESPAA